MKTKHIFLAFLLVASMALGVSESSAGTSKVIATFRPVQIIAQAVAGDLMQIDLLVEPGTDFHDYYLKPSEVSKLYEADLVIIGGAGLEDPLTSGLRQARRVTDASRGVDIIRKKRSGTPDPHIWLDPKAVAIMARNIADALGEEDPANTLQYEKNASDLEQKLKDLNSELAADLAGMKRMTLITYHESFNYFCRAYGIRTFSLTGPSAETPLPERVRRAYDIAREDKVRAVFTESGASGESFMQKMREDLGVDVCVLDTMNSDERDYFEAMRYNAAEIVRCLGAK